MALLLKGARGISLHLLLVLLFSFCVANAQTEVEEGENEWKSVTDDVGDEGEVEEEEDQYDEEDEEELDEDVDEDEGTFKEDGDEEVSDKGEESKDEGSENSKDDGKEHSKDDQDKEGDEGEGDEGDDNVDEDGGDGGDEKGDEENGGDGSDQAQEDDEGNGKREKKEKKEKRDKSGPKKNNRRSDVDEVTSFKYSPHADMNPHLSSEVEDDVTHSTFMEAGGRSFNVFTPPLEIKATAQALDLPFEMPCHQPSVLAKDTAERMEHHRGWEAWDRTTQQYANIFHTNIPLCPQEGISTTKHWGIPIQLPMRKRKY